MSQVYTRIANDKVCVLSVHGYFNMQLQREFRAAFESNPPFVRYAVDMKHCAGIDSAGLGLLLLLRDYAQADQQHLLITQCSPEVRKVLEYASFDQIFTIVD